MSEDQLKNQLKKEKKAVPKKVEKETIKAYLKHLIEVYWYFNLFLLTYDKTNNKMCECEMNETSMLTNYKGIYEIYKMVKKNHINRIIYFP